MKKMIRYISVFLFLTPFLIKGQNFEGIIIFKRKTNKDRIAIETYYFGKKKLRIDSRFFFENEIKDYIAIFDFKKYTNLYHSGEKGMLKEKVIRNSLIDTVIYSPIDTINILDYQLSYRSLIKYEDNVEFDTEVRQIRYLAQDLFFEVPDDWILDYTMISNFDKRIVLSMKEEIMGGGCIKGGYTRQAIAIIPIALPEKMFDVDSLNKSELYLNQIQK